MTAGVLGACQSDDAISATPAASGPSGGMGPAAPSTATPGGSTSTPSGSTGSGPAPGGTSTEGNPTVTGGLNGPAMSPPAVTPPPRTPPGTSVIPGAAEPTDCTLPPVITTAIGYGAAATGGGNTAPVVVDTYEAAQAALDAYRAAFKAGTQTAFVLRYTGTFDYSTITDVCAQHLKAAQILEIKELQNLTIEGASGSSANFGLKVTRAKNVIIRNMTLGLLPGGGSSDAITLEGSGVNGDVENVWVDHNDLFSDTKDDCEGAGDTEFDGLIDIKKGARRITVSYNYLHDHQKTGLLGSSDDDLTERYVTFHHNRYENVVSRTPLHRFGYIHAFNNYYGTITSSGINVRMGGVALIESNFFENALNPVTSRYSAEVGLWDLRNNHVGPNVTWDVEEDTLANADTWQSTTTFPANELNYTYTPDRAGCVKQIVAAQAGAKL